MTDRAPRRRASRRTLRGWAWLAGGLAFFAPLAALGASPTPATDTAQGERERPVLVIRTITRRVIVREQPAQAPVQYVYAPSSSGPGTVAATSPGGTDPAPAPAPAPPPPTTTTGGS
ncbi:MAG: hypothetical protein ACXWXQ_02740 [Actinomycetota bacterium]